MYINSMNDSKNVLIFAMDSLYFCVGFYKKDLSLRLNFKD